jgi:hypothetical protein
MRMARGGARAALGRHTSCQWPCRPCGQEKVARGVGAGRKPGVFILVLAAAFAVAATAQTLALQNRWA